VAPYFVSKENAAQKITLATDEADTNQRGNLTQMPQIPATVKTTFAGPIKEFSS
jgi:hypothetical protein